jgi:GNAT superfamily N-acetyltransferase
MNGFHPMTIVRENGLAFRSYIPAEYFEDLLKKNRYGVGLTTEDDRAAGAIACTREDGALIIDSIFVDKSVRGRGAGAMLTDSAKALAEEFGVPLYARYPWPARRELELFFLKMGFVGPEAGNAIFDVPLEAIRKSEFLKQKLPEADRIVPFGEAPKQAVFEYRARIDKDIPALVSLEKAPGRLIPEATLVCLHDGRICSFIVSTVLEDGSLYLNSLYSEKARAKNLQGLVQTALRALCDRGGAGDMLHVAAHNEAGLKIIEHLLRENPEQTVKNTIHSMVFYPKNERYSGDMNEFDNAIPVLDMLMPKLSGLSELMIDLGIENDLMVRATALPYIAVRTKTETKFSDIRLMYIPTDLDDAGKYVLTAMAKRPAADVFLLPMLCNSFNANTPGPVAYSDPTGEMLCMRSNLPEKDIPVSAAVFAYFWEIFSQGLADMDAMIAEDAGGG